MDRRILLAIGLLAAVVTTLVLLISGDIPAPPWVPLGLGTFLAVFVVSLGFYSYFQSVEARLRRSAAWMLLTSGVVLALKVVLGWSVDIQLQGGFKFFLARGEPWVDVATLGVAVIFALLACWLIWLGHKSQLAASYIPPTFPGCVEYIVIRVSGATHDLSQHMRFLLRTALLNESQLQKALAEKMPMRNSIPLLLDGLRQFGHVLYALLTEGQPQSLRDVKAAYDAVMKRFRSFGDQDSGGGF